MLEYVDCYITPCNASGYIFKEGDRLIAAEIYCGCRKCTDDCTMKCIIDDVYSVEYTTEENMDNDLKEAVNKAYIADGQEPLYKDILK